LVGGFSGYELPNHVASALAAAERAGVILFKRNFNDPAQVARLCRRIAEVGGPWTPWVGIDQEGGRVSRLGPPVLQLPAMRLLGSTHDASLTERAAHCLGLELGAFGFNVDFAPVVDVDTHPQNPVIGDRAFSSDPAEVARLAGAFAQGLIRAGVMPCGKHFPGHGDTTLDSHLALPTVAHGPKRLAEVEIVPFRRLAPVLPALMTAHVLYPALDPRCPATLSRAVAHDLLRNELGFQGVLFSDDLEMAALDEPIEQTAVQSVRAGCDVLLICKSWDLQQRAHDALVHTARRHPEFLQRCREAVARSTQARSAWIGTSSQHRDARSYEALFASAERQALEADLAPLRV
jgi:beta-N-acetylhexosaminidase